MPYALLLPAFSNGDFWLQPKLANGRTKLLLECISVGIVFDSPFLNITRAVAMGTCYMSAWILLCGGRKTTMKWIVSGSQVLVLQDLREEARWNLIAMDDGMMGRL
jgi:hypothetical protein